MPRQHVSSRLHPGAEQDEIRSQGLFRMYNFHCDFRLILVVFLPTEGLTGFASVFLWKSKKNSKQNSATHVCRAGEMTIRKNDFFGGRATMPNHACPVVGGSVTHPA